ncbi:hypothetical protein LMG29542_07455 [Paraburkholderia humisilvae]|uniref:Uncharacterized protein n=1 Tax=Paraburkholderia humisilvae TaxID=627669 RepID=A0A6J5F4U3_9BURK|nr:hypothetical protein LMG29542_07455 [Paraburkholderia humisilvae]
MSLQGAAEYVIHVVIDEAEISHVLVDLTTVHAHQLALLTPPAVGLPRTPTLRYFERK